MKVTECWRRSGDGIRGPIGFEMLIIFSGLPGVGKTTLARELGRRVGAAYLRIDSIEAGLEASVLAIKRAEDAGYRAAYNIARDNLLNGGIVVADSVNPIQLTRDAWRDVAVQAGVQAVEIEVICSDLGEHQRRVEDRRSGDPEAGYPTWQAVQDRHYDIWDRDRLVIDTAGAETGETVRAILQKLPKS